jgi:thiol-disulfide isomerase/thioredoxin
VLGVLTLFMVCLSPAVVGQDETPVLRKDAKVEEVMRSFADTVHDANAYQFRYVVYARGAVGDRRGGTTLLEYKVSVERPNKFTILPKNKSEGIGIVCDGEKVSVSIPHRKKYFVEDAPATLQGVAAISSLAMIDPSFELASHLSRVLEADPYAAFMRDAKGYEYLGTQKMSGVECHHMKLTSETGTSEFWVKAKGKPVLTRIEPEQAPARVGLEFGMVGAVRREDTSVTVTLEEWKLDPKLPGRTFAFKEPRGMELGSSITDMLTTGPLVGEKAPQLKLDQLKGDRFDLAGHKDRDVVILDFWATWCGPCKAGMPILMEVAKEYKDRGVVLYAVNLQESTDVIQSFLASQQWELTVALDKSGDAAKQFMVGGIPHTVIIGKDGVIRFVHIGFSPDMKEKLRTELQSLL